MTVQVNSSQTFLTPQDSSDNAWMDHYSKNKDLREQLQSWATWTEAQYTMCSRARKNIETQWYLNLAFFYGNQYLAALNTNGSTLTTSSGRLRVPAAPPWRTRLVVNRVRPIIRAELSKLTSQKPSASVVPASNDDQDMFAAQAAEQIWESTYSRLKINRKFRHAAFWTCITGNGFLKTWWDPTIEDKVAGTQGDICVEAVSPWHLFVPDLREQDIEKQLYVINSYTRAYDLAMIEFGKEFEQMGVTPQAVTQDKLMEEKKLNLSTGSDKLKVVLCHEIWLKPGAHKDFPTGGRILVVGGVVVDYNSDGIPYAHGMYPFIHFSHIESGKFYATSVIEDVIPLQREYNRTRSQLIEAKNRMAKPQLTGPEGSLDPSKITTEPGQFIPYKLGMAPPTPIPLSPMPNYVMEEMDRTLADIEDITSQHQVSKGNVPPGVTAATAISYLQEKDDSVLSTTTDSVEEGFEKLATQVLSLIVEYWDTERTVKIVGDDGSFDTLVLKGSKIANAQDIRMEGGSALPTSKSARQAFLMDLIKMGVISGNDGLRLMEIGGVQKLYEYIQIDERQAQRENIKMKLLDINLINQWNQEQDQAAAFAGQVQAMQNMDPANHGLPSDMPVLPPDFPGNTPQAPSPTGGMGNAANGAPPQPQLPGMDQMQQPEPPAVTSLPNGTIQSTEHADPSTGLPLNPPPLVPVNTWDNDALHIEVHNRFRKSQEFEKLSDEHKQIIEKHVADHAAKLNTSANAAMMGGMPPDQINAGPGSMPGGAPNPDGANQFPPDMGGGQNG
jgi:hypothetical protein